MARSLRRLEPVEIAAGADETITIGLYDASNDALSVSGASASWKLFEAVPRRRRKPFRGNAVLEKTSAAGQIALSAGQAVVTIDDSDLSGKSGEFWQSIQITDSSGDVSVLGQGPVYVRAGV